MAYHAQLFRYCRNGDINKLKALSDEKGLDLNIRDSWDSTPLYYACLCGHYKLVEYLLHHGAKCIENTFDGERCLYGALTNDIRTLLKTWKQIHPVGMQRHRHYEMLRILMENGTFSDINLIVHGESFHLHRCILAARSQYFAEAFSSRWKNRDTVSITNKTVALPAFKAILQYLYTGRFDVQHEMITDTKRLAKNCKLDFLNDEIDHAIARLAELVKLKPMMAQRVKVLTVESEQSHAKLVSDLKGLVDQVVPPSLNNWIEDGILPFTAMWRENCLFADVCFVVDGHCFLGHKAFICSTCDYFRARLDDHFMENNEINRVPAIFLKEMSHRAFKHIVVYIYTDHFESDNSDDVLETLYAAHMFLLHGLSRKCSQVLENYLDESNVIDYLKTARNLDLARLENRCTAYMAQVLEKLLELDEFAQLVEEDAASVIARHDTDSIPIVDDIRYHISSSLQSYGQLDEVNTKLAGLDALLARLGMEC